jgi:hypothetical protein
MAANTRLLPTKKYDLNKPIFDLVQEAMDNLVTLHDKKLLGKAGSIDALADPHELSNLLGKELEDLQLRYYDTEYEFRFAATPYGSAVVNYELNLEVSATKKHPFCACFVQAPFLGEIPIGALERAQLVRPSTKPAVFNHIEPCSGLRAFDMIMVYPANDLKVPLDDIFLKTNAQTIEELRRLSVYLKPMPETDRKLLARTLHSMMQGEGFYYASEGTLADVDNLVSDQWLDKVNSVVSDMKSGIASWKGAVSV